jgi:hypothetical protein
MTQSARPCLVRIVREFGGWTALCSCGWTDRCREDREFAWRHAQDHLRPPSVVEPRERELTR